MRIARIATDKGPRPVIAQGDRWADVIDPFADTPVFTGVSYPVEAAHLLAPVRPLVVLGMAHNGAPGDRDLGRRRGQRLRRHRPGPGPRRHRRHRSKRRADRHPRQQRRSATPTATARRQPGRLEPGHHHRPHQRLPRRSRGRPASTRPRLRQDHQHLFRANRSRPTIHRPVHRRQGRATEPHPRHDRRMGRRRPADQRHCPRLHPHRNDPGPGRRHGLQRLDSRPHPAARWGTVEDLIGPAVFFASPASDYVNGQVLFIDGGMTAVV
jgi:hypothetical protein